MAKGRIARNELVDKIVEMAASVEDPLRTMAEMITRGTVGSDSGEV